MDGRLGGSFFCSRDFKDRRDLRYIFPTLAVQLAYGYQEIRSILVPFLRTNPGIVHESLYNQRVRRGVVSSGVRSKRVLLRIRRTLKQRVWPLLRHPLLPIAIPLRNAQVQESEPWLGPEDLAIIRRINVNDVRWILRNITDPEALDAAIRLAGTIRWFDDGFDPDLPYDLIVSTFEGCFDPAGKLYPGSRDRAYYSGRAMVWIHTLARCESWDFAYRFPLFLTKHEGPGLDPDLTHLLRINQGFPHRDWCIARPLTIDPEHTPSHAQWVSDVLLHHSWVARSRLSDEDILDWISDARERKVVIPLILNRLLLWCIIFGSPPAKEALMIQNKSYDISCFALQIAYSTLH